MEVHKEFGEKHHATLSGNAISSISEFISNIV